MKPHAIKYAARWRRQACCSSTPTVVGGPCFSMKRPSSQKLKHHGFALEYWQLKLNYRHWWGDRHMKSPPLDPPVSDCAPSAAVLTRYDEQHLVTYLRLLDAEAEGAD